MKKTILNIALLATIVVGGNGCKKFLEEKPLEKVEISRYFKSVRDINASVAGVYASFQQEMTGGGDSKTWGKYHYWGEARADNFDKTQYYTAYSNEIAFNGLSSGNAAATWAGLYRTIGRANNCIKYIPQVPEFDRQATKAIIDANMAQVYAMRAMSYFYIIRLWGDAPIWLEPYTDVYAEPKRAREPKQKIIDEIIIPDLQKAYDLIPKNATPVQWYIGEGAISAIMADVYMWLNQPDKAMPWFQNLFKAKSPAGKVYNGQVKEDLVAWTDWKKIFLNANTIENIWSIHWDYAVNGCACTPVSIYHNNSPLKLDSVVYKDWPLITPADLRAKETIDFNAGSLQDRLLKFYPKPTTGNPVWNDDTKKLPVYLVMYRLSDMMLLYAEAANQLGDAPTALKWLNIVHERAGLGTFKADSSAIDTPDKMERMLLRERRYELFGEGKRWFDLVRTGTVEEVMDPILKIRQTRAGADLVGFGDDKRRYYWPINRTLIENNPLLIQNLPYN
ncbi:MAG: RagB/SusD family nutrient uptake outer membrane protein [Chitinophagaceae bacterium]|nr:RagB/SusD family nutrient uptake outer membrane protein [Chitinophagaceae bacterium]